MLKLSTLHCIINYLHYDWTIVKWLLKRFTQIIFQDDIRGEYLVLSLTLREECRLRVFENRILGRIFGPKRDVNGKWRSFHNDELYRSYRSPNTLRVIKSRRLRYAGHKARMEEIGVLSKF